MAAHGLSSAHSPASTESSRFMPSSTSHLQTPGSLSALPRQSRLLKACQSKDSPSPHQATLGTTTRSCRGRTCRSVSNTHEDAVTSVPASKKWETLEEAHALEARTQGSAVTYENQATDELLMSCTTFNVLAPIYKRLGGMENVRESQFPEQWRPRNSKIIMELLKKKSSIVCLQELWLANPHMVSLYDEAFMSDGYSTFKLPRPNGRGDGLLTAVRTDKLEVVGHENLQFNDGGDRVAQFLWVRSKPGTCTTGQTVSCSDADSPDPCLETIVVNTHLLFPHDATSSIIRLRQVYKVMEHLESFKAKHGLGPVPVVLCGDLNGTKRGQVYNFLRSQGFVSSYDIAHNHPDEDERWVSHRNHHGVVCGVDFIWLLNPTEQRSTLSLDWKAAVFNSLKKKLERVGCESDVEAFNFFCGDSSSEDEVAAGDCSNSLEMCKESGSISAGKVITVESMEVAVAKIGSEMALSTIELEEMVASADADGNGSVDFSEFQDVLKRSNEAAGLTVNSDSDSSLPGECDEVHTFCEKLEVSTEEDASVACFTVTEASLYPPETKDGLWPSHYNLSDHALLTAVFSLADLANSVVSDGNGFM